MYRYKAQLVRVIDGDTIDFKLDLGFHISKLVRIRLRDFDAPEIRGEEREEGLKVKDRVQKLLSKAMEIEVSTAKDTSFDRWMGNVYCDGVNLVGLI